MRIYNLILLVLAFALLTTCRYEVKKTVGDAGAFGAASDTTNLLPSLNTGCGGSNCMR